MKIGVLGCTGRMGRLIAQQVLKNPGFELIGGSVGPGSPYEGKSLNCICPINTENHIVLTSNLNEIAQLADVLIDFTHPDSLSKQIGRTHVETPITTAHLVCRILLE